MTTPAISLIIPTYRRDALLKELLLALSDQSLSLDEFEAIVVVDGGSKETMDMLDSLDVPYCLRAVAQEQAGASVARNHGARLARGEVLAFLDDDMLPGRGHLKEHLRLHEMHPHAVVIGAYIPPSLGLVEGQGGWNVWEARVLQKHYRQVADGLRPPAGRRLYSGNFSVRRDDFWKTSGFDESLERGEDVDLGFRLEQAGLKYVYGDRTGALHRGFRSFDSWRRSAYLYGQCDAIFARERKHKVDQEVLGWYHRQKPAARWAVRLCVGRPVLFNAAIGAFASIANLLTRQRLHRFAHYGYSAIYKLQYWQGFIDELGGKDAFQKEVTSWRQGHQETRATDHKTARPV